MPIIQLVNPDLQLSKSVAIVSSSGVLNNRDYANIIDSHDEVIRFNRAPVKGYEDKVGEKTTVRVVNSHVFQCWSWSRWQSKGQNQYFIRMIKNCKIVCATPLIHEFDRCKKLVHSSCSSYLINYNRAGYLNGIELTVGFIIMHLLIGSNIKPSIFGFAGAPGGEGELALSHYWEHRDNKAYHNYGLENAYIKAFEKEKLIEWYK